MRLLFVHADYFAFETTTEARAESVRTDADRAETDAAFAETEEAPMAGQLDDCIAAFVTVERGDDADLDAAVANAAGAVREVAEHLGTQAIALSPSEHLSDAPAPAAVAAAALRKLETDLGDDFEVLRAPVGWHAAVELSSKGHPFAERSVRVGPGRDPGYGGDRGEAEGERGGSEADRATTEWKIAFPHGEVADARDAADRDRLRDELEAFVEAERRGGVASEPPATDEVVDRLRERGLADDADRGDSGSLRWFPRGKFVRDLVLERVTDLATEYGAMPVEATGAAGRRAARGPGRADPFSRVADGIASGTVPERDLPLRLFEVVTRSSPDDRRAFATPEIRTAVRDAAQAREELRDQVELLSRVGEDLGLNYVTAIRTPRAFYDQNRAWIESLVADLGDPVLLELRPEGRDRSIRVDFAVVDDAGRSLANPRIELTRGPAASGGSAGEIDSENDSNDADGTDEENPPWTLCCAPVDSIERVLAALLEPSAGRDAPHLPTWLAPTQVRFVPVGGAHVAYCEALADDLDAAGVRVDVDDREETVGERLARAEADLVPYYAVVGDREVAGEDGEPDGDDVELAVTVRAEAAERELDLAELRAAVFDAVGDLPTKRRYLPRRVSRHPDFAGQ